MESLTYRNKYKEAIKTLEDDASLDKTEFNLLKEEAQKEQQDSIANRICGTSFEHKFYHKLVIAGLIVE